MRAEIGEDKVGVSPRGGRLVIFHSDHTVHMRPIVVAGRDGVPTGIGDAARRRGGAGGRVAVVGWLRAAGDEAASRDCHGFEAEALERWPRRFREAPVPAVPRAPRDPVDVLLHASARTARRL